MKRKKFYWKVVAEVKGNSKKYASAMIDNGKYRLRYAIGKETKSVVDGNGIFVFKTRRDARQWRRVIYLIPPGRILKVRVEGEEIPYEEISIYDVYTMRLSNRLEPTYYRLPHGTTSFPSVIPIELVH